MVIKVIKFGVSDFLEKLIEVDCFRIIVNNVFKLKDLK